MDTMGGDGVPLVYMRLYSYILLWARVMSYGIIGDGALRSACVRPATIRYREPAMDSSMP